MNKFLAGFLIYLAVINLATMLVFGFDKLRAKRDGWRVPESTLFLLAAIGGSIGAILGMRVFHNKTRHKKFVFGIPLILLLQLALLICWKLVVA